MRSKKLSLLGLLTALAMVLSFVESLVPPLMPGVKLGLANAVTVFVLYSFGAGTAAAVSFVRILLVSLLFASPLSFAYSMAGGALSLLAMAGLRHTRRFSCVSVSAVGGVCHNIGQIAVACFVTGTRALAWLLPVLLFSGIAAGAAIGLLAGIVLKRLGCS